MLTADGAGDAAQYAEQRAYDEAGAAAVMLHEPGGRQGHQRRADDIAGDGQRRQRRRRRQLGAGQAIHRDQGHGIAKQQGLAAGEQADVALDLGGDG
jgi:hypothetical protein